MPVALIIAVALLATVRAYVGDDASGNFHRSVIDDAKFIHFPAAAGGKADGSYGNFVFAILIIVFTYFYTAITINPNQMAEDMKRNNGFIPGIKPGKNTACLLYTS